MTGLKLENAPAWSEVEEFLDRMRSLYRKRELPLRDLLLFSLYPTTGLKTSELIGVRREDVDLQAGIMRIRGSGKEVVILPSLVPHLKEHLKGLRDGDRIFDLSERQVLNLNHQYTSRVLGRKLRISDWRHAFAMRILEKVKDPSACKRLLGYKSTKVMRQYERALERDLRDDLIRAIEG